MKTKIIPVGKKVLIKPKEAQRVVPGTNIIIPDSALEKEYKGFVVGVGAEVSEINEGDLIQYAEYSVHANGVLEFHRIEYKAGYKCSEHEHQFKWNGFFVESGKMLGVDEFAQCLLPNIRIAFFYIQTSHYTRHVSNISFFNYRRGNTWRFFDMTAADSTV